MFLKFKLVFSFNLDPVFNFIIFVIFLFLFLLTPHIFIAFSAKIAKLKETQKRKNTICEHTCANCSCQNVRFFFFFLHLSLLPFFGISCFFRDVLIGFQKSKITKHEKQHKPKTTTTRKQDAKQKQI